MHPKTAIKNEINGVFAELRLKLVSVLFSRMLFFFVFQVAIALILNSWSESEKYWMLAATMGNMVSIFLLIRLFKIEGKNYLTLFRFDKLNWRKDLGLFIVLTLLIIPTALAPQYFMGIWLWDNPIVPYKILFQPIPNFVTYFLLVAFPLSIALAELTTYFGYVMPRLEKVVKKKWLAVFIPVIFLSFQHCFLPLVFDYKFIIYRGLMFFPFALLIGISLWKRPRMLPYFVILHGVLDMQAVAMLIIETNK